MQSLGMKKLPLRRRKAVNAGQLVDFSSESGAALPMVAKPAADGADLVTWLAENANHVTQYLHQNGAVLFRGFGPFEPAALESLIRAYAGEPLSYKERSSPRVALANRIYTSTEYPADQAIFPHNENSYQHTWPMKLFFLCVQPPASGGATPLTDCRKVLASIDPQVRQRFEDLGVRYVRNFNEGLGLPWQTVFQTEDPAQVDAYCAEKGIETEWRHGGGLRITSTRSAVLRHPDTGEETWFNHAAFFHVTSQAPEVVRSLRASYSEQDMPSNTFFGDGTPISDEVAEALREAYRGNTVRFGWQRGDVLFVENMLVAHSREAFQGERLIAVGMSTPMNREILQGGTS